MLNIRDFFPYRTLRPYQDKLISYIYDAFVNRTILFLQAPTGIGKTVSVIVGFLLARESNEPLIVATRTKNQAQIYVKEIDAINQKLINRGRKPLSFVVLRSRQDYCLYVKKKASYKSFIWLCKVIREKCPFYRNCYVGATPSERLSDALNYLIEKGGTPENILSIASRFKLCPYEIAKNLVADSDVIICSYPYLFSRTVRGYFLDALKKSLSDTKIVIDEADNLPEFILNANSSRLTVKMLQNLLAFLNEVYETYENVTDPSVMNRIKEFTELLNLILSEIEKLSKGSQKIILAPKEDFAVILDKSFARLVEIIEEIVLRIPTEEAFINALRLSELREFTDMFVEMQDKSELIVTKEEELALELRPLHAADIASEVFDNISTCIMMSGTLHPISYFKTSLGLDKSSNVQEKKIPSIYDPSRVIRLVDIQTTTKYTERNKYMYRLIAQRLKAISEVTPGAILIVFPSYSVMKAVMDELNKMDVDREIFVERRSSKIEKVMEFLSIYPDAIIACVAYGKFAEGIDFRIRDKTLLKAVVIAGLPFPEYNEWLRKQLEYLKTKFDYETARKLCLIYPMVRKTLQAAGRLIRSPEDFGAIIILDRRFLSLYKFFPKEWWTFHKFSSIETLKLRLSEFFNRLLCSF